MTTTILRSLSQFHGAILTTLTDSHDDRPKILRIRNIRYNAIIRFIFKCSILLFTNRICYLILKYMYISRYVLFIFIVQWILTSKCINKQFALLFILCSSIEKLLRASPFSNHTLAVIQGTCNCILVILSGHPEII